MKKQCRTQKPVVVAALIIVIVSIAIFSVYVKIDTIGEFKLTQSAQKTITTQQQPAQTQQQKIIEQPLREQTVKIEDGDAVYVNGYGQVAKKSGDEITYYHQDYLSSNRFSTDSTEKISSESVYYPYGATLKENGQKSALSNYKFTGKENDGGLYYYGARYYDTSTARFISVDPLADASTSPYMYVADNPLKFVDPTGESKFTPQQQEWIRKQIEEQERPRRKAMLVSLGVTAGVVCISTICTGGAALPFWGAVAMGAAEGATISTATQLIMYGKIKDPTDVVQSTTLGGAMGGAANMFARGLRFIKAQRALQTADDVVEEVSGTIDDVPKLRQGRTSRPAPVYRILEPVRIESTETGNIYRLTVSEVFEQGKFVDYEFRKLDIFVSKNSVGKEVWRMLAPKEIEKMAESDAVLRNIVENAIP